MIGLLLIGTGILLTISLEAFRDNYSLTHKELVILGLIQGFSILPGISRSGVTITTLLLQRVNAKSALFLSFLISVPPVLGIFILSGVPDQVDLQVAIVMLLTSFCFGAIMMETLMQLAQKFPFQYFCYLLGLITIVFSVL